MTEEVLSLRIAIKLNGRGARVSVLFAVIKRTSRASHSFSSDALTHTLTVGMLRSCR